MDSLAIHPIIDWSEQDVFDYLQLKGIPPNPLYLDGYSRVGCFPCIHARKREIAQLPEWVWERLEYWESRIGRSWFPSGILPGTRGTKKIPKLSEVRAWSKTLRGGKEIDESIDEKDPPSCMASWGHCE